MAKTRDNAGYKLLNILIVEDNETDYLLLLRQVKLALIDVTCARAENRAELQQALTQDWHLIITDFHLPDIEENELLNTIAAAHAETPCIVLSGSVTNLQNIPMPANVFDCIEKGNHQALHTALTRHWQ